MFSLLLRDVLHSFSSEYAIDRSSITTEIVQDCIFALDCSWQLDLSLEEFWNTKFPCFTVAAYKLCNRFFFFFIFRTKISRPLSLKILVSYTSWSYTGTSFLFQLKLQLTCLRSQSNYIINKTNSQCSSNCCKGLAGTPRQLVSKLNLFLEQFVSNLSVSFYPLHLYYL